MLLRLESGDLATYSAVCARQAWPVAHKDGKIACPCHGSVFDPAKGAAILGGPTNQPLPGVGVREGEVFLA